MGSADPKAPTPDYGRAGGAVRSDSQASQSTAVLLVRHGETPTTGSVLPGRTPGLHLAPAGEAQARRAAERISALGKIAAVYSSPMERTLETASVIARACRLRVRWCAGLTECDFGEWTGRELKHLREREEWKAVQRNPSGFRFPGGESFAEMQARATGAVADIVRRHPGEAVVAVSHADVIKSVVAAAVGTPLDLFQRIMVSLCSISVIAYRPEGPVVLAVNTAGDGLDGLRGLDGLSRTKASS